MNADDTTTNATHDLVVVSPRVVVAAAFPLSIEFLPDENRPIVSSANDDDENYWSTASVVRRLRSHFDAVLASARAN